MKRSNATYALATLVMVAAYMASGHTANAGGFIQGGISSGSVDAGISVGNPFGQGFGYRGGLCGISCGGSAFSSQYNGLPSYLPQQPLAHQVPVMPNIQGGWVNTGGYPGMGGGYPGMGGGYPGYPGGGYPGGGYPGYPGGGYPGYPGGGYPGGGYPGRYPCGFNPCANNGFYPPIYQPMPPMQVPGGPCGMCGRGGGAIAMPMPMPAPMPSGGMVSGGYVAQNEWEKNDTAAIVWGVSAGLSSMTSNVYPVAYQRQDITIPTPQLYYQGGRYTGYEPRTGITHTGSGTDSSVFQ